MFEFNWGIKMYSSTQGRTQRRQQIAATDQPPPAITSTSCRTIIRTSRIPGLWAVASASCATTNVASASALNLTLNACQCRLHRIMATIMSNYDSDNAWPGQPTTTPSKPSAAFPQGPVAFPSASTPKPSALERILNELTGPKPAY